MPTFPKKRFMGSMDPAFLNQRMTELGQFFNALLSKPEVASVHLVMTYFVSARADKESESKIIQLN